MRTVLIVIVSVLCSVAATAFFLKPQHSSQKEVAYERVINSGTLRCGYAISPPMMVADPNTGDVSGLDVEIWREIGTRLGLKIEWAEEAGWGNFIEGLRTGRYDAFCSQLWPDRNRSKFLTLAGPVTYSFLYTVARADDRRFDGNFDRINQPDVGIPVIDGDISYDMAVTGFPKARHLTLPQTANVTDMLESIITKKADVMFFEEGMLNAMPPEKLEKLRIVPGIPISFTFASYYGLRSGEYALRDMIGWAIRAMIDDGTLRKLQLSYSKGYVTPRQNHEGLNP